MEHHSILAEETTPTPAEHKTAVVAQPHKRTTPIRRGLSSFGGYALLTDSCPPGSSTCGSDYCCPSNYTCDVYYKYDPPICCPSSADCKPTVNALKACADNSWGLYEYSVYTPDYFCCPEDAIGAKPSDANYLCISKSLSIPSSITLSEIKQATGTRATSTTLSLATSSESVSVTEIPTASAPDIAGPSTSNEATRGSTRKGVPQGAVIAIAVLSILVVLLLISSGWLYYRWRNMRRRGGGQHPIHPQITERREGISGPPLPRANTIPCHEATELFGDSVTGPARGLDAAHRVELDARRRIEA